MSNVSMIDRTRWEHWRFIKNHREKRSILETVEAFIAQLCAEFQLWDESLKEPPNQSDRWTFQLGEVRFARQECKILTKIEYLSHLVQFCSEPTVHVPRREANIVHGGNGEIISLDRD